MKNYINYFYTFISYGIINKGAVRMRTRGMFVLVSSQILTGVILIILGFLKASEKVGGVVIILSSISPYLMGKIIDPYVDNNWRLFNPRAKIQIKNRIMKVILSWIFFLLTIVFLVLCFVWFLKNTV